MESLPLIQDFMDKKFITFEPDMDVYEAISIILDKRITGAAVIDKNSKLLGILTEKDCLRTLVHAAYSELPSGTVKDYMTSPVLTISPDQDIFSVADLFLKQAFRRLPVVKNGELVGQITRRDLLRVIQKIETGKI